MLVQTRRKLIIDQDAHGPASTNLQSVLMLLQALVEFAQACAGTPDAETAP